MRLDYGKFWEPRPTPPRDGQDFDGFLSNISQMARSAPNKGNYLESVAVCVGEWFIDKFRARAAEAGHRNAATQLRKQGVPFHQALLILLGTGERFAHLHA